MKRTIYLNKREFVFLKFIVKLDILKFLTNNKYFTIYNSELRSHIETEKKFSMACWASECKICISNNCETEEIVMANENR